MVAGRRRPRMEAAMSDKPTVDAALWAYIESIASREPPLEIGVFKLSQYNTMVRSATERAAYEGARDPNTRVTAFELRDIGCDIPAEVPDGAWVPRSALLFGEPKTTMNLKTQRIRTEIPVTVNAAWSLL